MTDTPATLAEALAAVQTRLPQIKKTERANVRSDKGNYSYTYANLAGISAAVLPLLGEVGLSWTTKPTLNAEGKFVLAFKLLHASGEYDSGEYPLPTTGTPQAIGGAITYARRYALCAVTGVAPEDDDDDAAAASQQDDRPAATATRRRTAQRRNTQPAANGNGNGDHAAGQPDTAAGAPPLPGEAGTSGGAAVTQPQLARIHATFGDLDVSDREKRRAIVSKLLDRTVTSVSDLSRAEAGRLIDELTSLAKDPDAPFRVAGLLGNPAEPEPLAGGEDE